MAYPTLNSGEYLWDQDAQRYVFSAADAGSEVTATLNWTPNQIIGTELVVVPSSAPYTYIPSHGGMQQITESSGSQSNSVIFTGDRGAAYYPSGTPLTRVASNPAAGEYSTAAYIDPSTGQIAGADISVDGVGGYGQYTFAAADAGKEIVITYEYLDPGYDPEAGAFGAALTVRNGAQSQPASSYMESKHPDQSVGYSRTALIEGDASYLGMSGVMPNYSYEVQGIGVVGGGIQDADPVAVAQTLLTDLINGVGIPASAIDQASWFTAPSSAEAWVAANQFYISQALENPTGCGSLIGRWLEAFNIAAVWSEGVLKLRPYGDQAIGGYTPNGAVVAALDDDDFLADGNNDPVRLTRTAWADAYNRVQVGYKSRANSYNDDIVYEQDEGSVERFGLRPEGSQSLDFVSTWQVASAVANMRLKRLQQVRTTYEFALPITYEYLEPMDLVEITDSRLGIDAQIVRVTKVENDPHHGVTVTCEDYPAGGYAVPVVIPKAVTPLQHPTQGSASTGGTNLVIVQASNSAAGQQSTQLYIWCVPADSASWSGCAVYMSRDGSTYEPLEPVSSPGQLFSLKAALPSVASSPSGPLDLTHDASNQIQIAPLTTGNQIVTTASLPAYDPEAAYVGAEVVTYDGEPWAALAPSTGVLPTLSGPYWCRIQSASASAAPPTAVTDTAAANLANLAAVIALNGGEPTALEFLSFASVAAGAQPNTYTLSDLYRGALGTAIGSFPSGSQLAIFAGASTSVKIPSGLAGTTLYFKAVAWNQGGVASQTLASAPVTEFVVAASGTDGVADGISSPIGDVIANNGGNGELIVNPKGGVSGNLPHVNSSAEIQSVIPAGKTGTVITGLKNASNFVLKGVGDPQLLDLNNETKSNLSYGRSSSAVQSGLTQSGNFTSGRLLGGDSGLEVLGGGGLLGFGLSPTSELVEIGGDAGLYASNVYQRWDDTISGSHGYYRQSTGGILHDGDSTAVADRLFLVSTGFYGIGRTPASNILEPAGNVESYGPESSFGANATESGATSGSWGESAGSIIESRQGTPRRYVTSIGHGFDRVPASNLLEAAGVLESVAAAAQIAADDTTSGGIEATWMSQNAEINEWTPGVQVRWSGPAHTGFYRAPIAYALETAGNLFAAATTPAMLLDDTGSGGREFDWGSISGVMRMDDVTASASRLFTDGGGQFGIGGNAADLLSAFGDAGLYASNVYQRWNDTISGSHGYYRQSTSGILHDGDSTAAADRLFLVSTGFYGIGRTPASNILEPAGNVESYGPESSFGANATESGATWGSWGESSGSIIESRQGTTRRYVTSIGHGFDRVPASNLLEAAGVLESVAAAAQIAADDTTSGGIEATWMSQNAEINEWTPGVQVRWSGPAHTGFYRAPIAYALETAGNLFAAATTPAMLLDDTGSGGREFDWGAISGVMRMDDVTASASRLYVSTGGEFGVGGTPMHTLDVFGDHNVSGVYRVGGNQFAGGSGSGLDLVYDGATYGRPLLARLASGKPWIDFSEAIHANKTLDYMGDGSIFRRLAHVASDNTLHASTALNNIGSFTQSNPGGIFQYSTQVVSPYRTAIWCNAGTITMRDGSTLSIPATGSATEPIAWLTLNQNYTNYIEGWLDIATGTITLGLSDQGSPAGVMPCSQTYQMAHLLADGNVCVLFDWEIFVPNGGGGGGGGGGTGGSDGGAGGRTLI